MDGGKIPCQPLPRQGLKCAGTRTTSAKVSSRSRVHLTCPAPRSPVWHWPCGPAVRSWMDDMSLVAHNSQNRGRRRRSGVRKSVYFRAVYMSLLFIFFSGGDHWMMEVKSNRICQVLNSISSDNFRVPSIILPERIMYPIYMWEDLSLIRRDTWKSDERWSIFVLVLNL